MIQLGIKTIACFSLVWGVLYAEEGKPQAKAPSIYSQLKSVAVNSVIAGSKVDRERIQAEIQKTISTFGMIESDKPSNFGTGQSILEIMIGPIANGEAPAKYFPVVFVSMKLKTGSQLIADPQFQVIGQIWEKIEYIDGNSAKLNDQVIKAVDDCLSELKTNYQKSEIKPVFQINFL